MSDADRLTLVPLRASVAVTGSCLCVHMVTLLVKLDNGTLTRGAS
jgi:hypothetical protein